MTRHAIFAALPLLALLAPGTVAFAQAVPQKATLTVKGAAAQLCTLAAPQVDVGGATNVGNFSGSTVVIAELSDSDTLSTKAADFDIHFAAMCNFDHKIVVSSDRGGLWLTGGPASHSGFANAVPYNATFTWAGQSSALSATAASEGEVDAPLDVNQPAYGDVTVHFHVDQGATNAGTGIPLVAGTYEDILRVTLGAQ